MYLFIQKQQDQANYSDDESFSIFELCRRFYVPDDKKDPAKEKKVAFNKIARSVARETERSRFASVEIGDKDIKGGGLTCHCLTTSDDLSGVIITNSAYRPQFAKKLLNQMLLEFRDYFSFNPGMYVDVIADQPEWDHSLEFPGMDDLLEQWKKPE